MSGCIVSNADDKAQSSPCQLPLQQDSHLQELDEPPHIVSIGIWSIATVLKTRRGRPHHIWNNHFIQIKYK